MHMNILSSVLVGTTLMIGTLAINPQQLINEAIAVVSVANTHQLNTALELYYSDNDRYPNATNGPELFEALRPYIKNQPLDKNAYRYAVTANGQDYTLSVDPNQNIDESIASLNGRLDQIETQNLEQSYTGIE